MVVCKVHPDTGTAASLGRSGLRLPKVAEQWEREHGGIVIDNRVRRRQVRERYADAVAGRMRYFKPDRRAATPQAKAEQRAAALDAARRRARDLHPLPPAGRGPSGFGSICSDACARRARRGTRRRPPPSDCYGGLNPAVQRAGVLDAVQIGDHERPDVALDAGAGMAPRPSRRRGCQAVARLLHFVPAL